MLERRDSMIDEMLVEEIQQLRHENEQLKHKIRGQKNLDRSYQNRNKKEIIQREAQIEHLEEVIFELAQGGKS